LSNDKSHCTKGLPVSLRPCLNQPPGPSVVPAAKLNPKAAGHVFSYFPVDVYFASTVILCILINVCLKSTKPLISTVASLYN